MRYRRPLIGQIGLSIGVSILPVAVATAYGVLVAASPSSYAGNTVLGFIVPSLYGLAALSTCYDVGPN